MNREVEQHTANVSIKELLKRGYMARPVFNSIGIGISFVGVGLGVFELKTGDEREALAPLVLAGIMILGVASNSLLHGKRIIENKKR